MSFWHQTRSGRGHIIYTKYFGVNAQQQQLALNQNGRQSSIFVDPQNMNEYVSAVMEAVSTREKVKKLDSFYRKTAGELETALANCMKSFTLKNWEKLGEAYSRLTAGLYITTAIGREGARLLEVRLGELGYSPEKIPEIMGSTTYPTQHTPLFDSQLELLQIGKEVQEKKLPQIKIDEKLNTWLLRNGYIPVNFNEDPWTLKDARAQLDSLLQKNCANELKRAKKEHEAKVNDGQKWLKKINDQQISALSYALQEGTLLNEFRKNIFSRVSLGMRPLFQILTKKMKRDDWRDCYYFTHHELGEILEGKRVPVDQITDDRKIVAFYTDKNGKTIFLTQEETHKLFEYVQGVHGQSKKTGAGIKVIKGFSANKGKVGGIAKVILNSKDFHKLQAKEILVTTMTSVDFVPLMEKAGAFVTNEGGITSHAAIVSREMNKPCIIGTKNGTQIIQDGDEIEVDGDAGIVTIIKKKIEVDQSEKNDYPFLIPEKYDPLWSIGELSFLFCSLYSDGSYTKHGDFVSYIGNDTNTFFISKKEREKLSKKGFELYYQSYDSFEKEVNHYLTLLKKEFLAIRKKKMSKLSQKELLYDFKHFVKLVTKLWDHYFWTEYFCADRVAEVLERKEKGLDLKKLQRNVDRMGKLKYEMRHFINEVAYPSGLLDKYTNEIGHRFKSVPSIHDYHYQEVISLLEGKKVPTPNRKTVIWGPFSNGKIITGTEAQRLFNQLYVIDTNVTVLKGQIGNKGKYRGIVKKIMFGAQTNYAKEIASMKKGEVLVSGSTGPELLLACKKAGAIITEEGGIISHATITARELGIPCVIGTKIATRVLNDGDLVEVDATNGVVKILKQGSGH